MYSDASEEILKGCSCGSRFFYYIRQEKLDELRREVRETITELDKSDKDQIEKDIRELTGLDEKPDQPVILDLESVRVIKPGKFEIDVVNLFSKKRPLIYKLEEGKYIIDLAASLKANKEEVDKKIRDPTKFVKEKQKEEKKKIDNVKPRLDKTSQANKSSTESKNLEASKDEEVGEKSEEKQEFLE